MICVYLALLFYLLIILALEWREELLILAGILLAVILAFCSFPRIITTCYPQVYICKTQVTDYTMLVDAVLLAIYIIAIIVRK